MYVYIDRGKGRSKIRVKEKEKERVFILMERGFKQKGIGILFMVVKEKKVFMFI